MENRGEPGAGVDGVWMGEPGVLALPGTLSTAKTSAASFSETSPSLLVVVGKPIELVGERIGLIHRW